MLRKGVFKGQIGTGLYLLVFAGALWASWELGRPASAAISIMAKIMTFFLLSLLRLRTFAAAAGFEFLFAVAPFMITALALAAGPGWEKIRFYNSVGQDRRI